MGWRRGMGPWPERCPGLRGVLALGRRDLVFDTRPDGRFAVIGSALGGVDASREEFEPDHCGEKAENYLFC